MTVKSPDMTKEQEIKELEARLKTYECGDERYTVDMARLRELKAQS